MQAKEGMIAWSWKPFAGLSTLELYNILQVRQQVFIVEQSCIYADVDGADLDSWHLMGMTPEGTLVAYLRVLAPTQRRSEPAIGRVLVASSARGQGLGRQLLAEGMKRTQQQFPKGDIVLSAQAHLEGLYEEFGFQAVSEPYLEDGILHIDMRWSTDGGDAALASVASG